MFPLASYVNVFGAPVTSTSYCRLATFPLGSVAVMLTVVVPLIVGAGPRNVFVGSTTAGWPAIVTFAGSSTAPTNCSGPPGVCWVSRFKLSWLAAITWSSICSNKRFPAGS